MERKIGMTLSIFRLPLTTPVPGIGSSEIINQIGSDRRGKKRKGFFFLLFFSPPLSVPVPVIFLRQSVSQSVSQRAQEPAELS